MSSKNLIAVAALCALASASIPTICFADGDQTTPTTFSDGSVATSWDHCGDTDICATVAYPGGDLLSIYSEGAAFCQPYILHFVRTNGARTVYEYSRVINHEVPTTTAFGPRCGNSLTTQMVLDHGLVHMTVSENHDGTLSITFSTAIPRQ